MRIVLQRVTSASVSIAGNLISSIEKGYMLLLGIHTTDTPIQADFLASKVLNLRIFPDEQGKMNLSLNQVKGSVLIVSQFTLYGDCSKGNRPSFIQAAPPVKGAMLYEYFVNKMRELVPGVATGIFGANMQVSLVNDGPVTLILER